MKDQDLEEMGLETEELEETTIIAEPPKLFPSIKVANFVLVPNQDGTYTKYKSVDADLWLRRLNDV